MSDRQDHVAANRQEFESVRDTLDTLALNLTNYGHTWSPELRTAYENAIAFLSRAASEPKATVKTKPGEDDGDGGLPGRRGMSAECKKLRGPNDTGPDCGCRGDACALGHDAASTPHIEEGPACPGCGLPNYSGLCPVCRGDEQGYRDELQFAFGPWFKEDE